MIKKQINIVLLFVIMFCANSAFAQKHDAALAGHVTCRGEHIPFVNIMIKDTKIGTATDASGHYMLSGVPSGDITVIVRAIGYKTKYIDIHLKDNQTKELNIDIREDIIELEGVVITADGNEISRKEAPEIVSVLSPKLFESTQAICVSDALNYQPGVRIETNCQNCGFTQLRMNGLEGPYTQILINNRKIFSAMTGVYGLEQIPVDMIKRVEVVRGGGSALSGSSAIGGTVNIITKDPTSNSFRIGTTIALTGKESADKSVNFYNSLVSNDMKSGVYIFGLYRDKDPFDVNGDGFSESTKLQNHSMGFKTYHKFSHLAKLSLEFHNIKEVRRGGNKFDYLPHESDITEQVDHNITGGEISFDKTNHDHSKNFSVFASGQTTNRDSYYGAEQDPSAYGNTTDLTMVAGMVYTQRFEKFLFAPSKLHVGIEDTYSNLVDKKLGYFDANSGEHIENKLLQEQELNLLGTFVQNEWDFAFMKVLLGVRYEIPDQSLGTGNMINPRANVLYKLNEKTQLRASYSRGYRAPQIFDEDLHILSSGARTIVHQISPDLIAETSNSVTASIDNNREFGKVQTYFLAESFYTKLNNPFIHENELDETTGILTSTKVNGDCAIVTGVNLESKISFSKKLQTQMGMTIQKSVYTKETEWGENPENTTNQILRTPNQYGYIVVDYQATKEFKTSLSGTYTGAMYVPHFAGGDDPQGNVITKEELLYTEQFYDLNLKLSYNFKLSSNMKLQVFGGIQNIFNSYQSNFDMGVNRDAGFVYGPSKPRTIFFGVKLGNGVN